MRTSSTLNLTLALGLAAGITASAQDLIPHWGMFTLDTAAISGPSKVKFGKDDKVIAAYRSAYDIKVIEYTGAGLNRSLADTGAGGDSKFDMAVDADGEPHIAFYDKVYSKVFYTRRSGGKWNHITLPNLHDKNYNVDWYQLCMNVDSKGGAHISYAREKANFPAQWYVSLDKKGDIADSGFVLPELSGKWNNMVMDKDDKPVIAFFRHGAEDFRIASRNGSAWKVDSVKKDTSSTLTKGFHCAISRVNDTLYRIVWQDKEKAEIWTATGPLGGPWAAEMIEDLEGFSFFHGQNAVANGKDGKPYVVYARQKTAVDGAITASSLVFAYKDGSEWKKKVVDSSGTTGLYAALAVNSKGMPAITYFDMTTKSIKMALGSETPISVKKSLPGKRPGKSKAGPRRDATGRMDAAPRDQGKVLYTRP